MKKLAVAGLVLAASVVFAPAAFAQSPAQSPNPGCGAALLALSQAEKAAADASAADTAAAEAKKADDALADAIAAVDTARAAAVNAGVSSANLNAAGAKSLRDERAAILTIPADQRTPAQVDRLIAIEKQLPLVEAFLASEAKAAVAKTTADRTDADALRREADKTDAAALADAAKKAEIAADKACGHNDGDLVTFENCAEVRAAGKAPLPSTDPDYRVGLDSDRDGIACETVEGSTSAPRIPSAIDTGYSA